MAINNNGDIGQIIWTDELNGSVTVKTTLIKDRKVFEETFNNYQSAFGKYPIDGVYQYKYGDGPFPIERHYFNSKEDTLKVKYFFAKNALTKRETWENERRSKLREGAPEYGIDKPAGCIPAEEDLIRYRVWVRRGTFNYKSKNNRLTKIEIPFEYSNSPRTIVYTYKDDKLISKKQIGKQTRKTQWEETYSYVDNKIIMTKKYFITYWDKIPPTETWTTEYDLNNKVIRVTKELEGQAEKEILEKSYYPNGNLKRLTKTINGTITKLDYLVTYK